MPKNITRKKPYKIGERNKFINKIFDCIKGDQKLPKIVLVVETNIEKSFNIFF